MAIHSINPATGRLHRSFDRLDEDAITRRIGIAYESFQNHRDVPVEHRMLCLRKLAGILEHEVDELARVATEEMGKTLSASRREVLACAAECRHLADRAAETVMDEPLGADGNLGYVRWEALGIVLGVVPSDAPYWQALRFAVPALMAGNVVLFKQPEDVPQTALLIEALIRRAGFPRGSFQTLLIEAEQVEFVLYDPRVAAVAVRGSELTGRAVAAQAGSLLKPFALELGGSDASLLMPSGDLSQAVRAAVEAMIDQGAPGLAARRLIVHEDAYDEFEAKLVAAVEALKVGDPLRETTEIGALATGALLERVEERVKVALQAGATVLTGGERMVGAGNYFEATVLAGVPRSAVICGEEMPGPLAMLFRVSSLVEAVKVANEGPCVRGAVVWTRDAGEQRRLVEELEYERVFVNGVGSRQRRGFGAAEMRAFMKAKTVEIAEAAEETRTTEAELEPLELRQDGGDLDPFAEAFKVALRSGDRA